MKTSMAEDQKKNLEKKDANSYTIKGTNIIIRAGDCVWMKPDKPNKPPYVARVEQLGTNKVGIRWYYRPEDTYEGRKLFHGEKELFISDHYDVQSTQTIQGKCVVHTFKDYVKLNRVDDDDYFARFEYEVAKKCLTDTPVAVYCTCEMPHNPDDFMVQCDGCEDWFHPSCMHMTNEEARRLEKFFCSTECSDV